MLKKLISKTKKILNTSTPPTKKIAYRVENIICDKNGEYKAVVQLVGKKDVFKMKPEEILANNKLTTLFHQHDIRLLTYLGYCGINTPQYKILAKKILANEGLELAIYDNKGKSINIKNIDDIPTNDSETISKMESQDAYELGFAHGRQSILEEKKLLKSTRQ
jgi:hypothetical protein